MEGGQDTYVRPVERRTPARKADTVLVLGALKAHETTRVYTYIIPRQRHSVRLCRAVDV
jgi:hypothetical protein